MAAVGEQLEDAGERVVGEIPALDLADPAYGPEEVAKFFMRLILRDLGA